MIPSVNRLHAVMRYCASLAALLVLASLAACSSVTTRQPAPIIDASILPEDVAPEPPAVCLPAETSLSPVPSQPLLVQRPRPVVRKPVKRPRPAPPPAVEASVAEPPAVVAPAPLIAVAVLEHGQVRGILDARVQRGNGRFVGRAVDAVANAQGGPRDLVVNLMGFMGVGDRKVNLPWNTITFAPGAPKADSFITLKSDSIDPAAPAPGGLHLLDASVRSKRGTEVGRVIDLLVDAGGLPRAVVMDVSGSLFHDKHLIAAAWSTIHVVGSGDEMHLETDLENRQIEASPPFESDKPIRVVTPAAGG